MEEMPNEHNSLCVGSVLALRNFSAHSRYRFSYEKQESFSPANLNSLVTTELLQSLCIQGLEGDWLHSQGSLEGCEGRSLCNGWGEAPFALGFPRTLQSPRRPRCTQFLFKPTRFGGAKLWVCLHMEICCARNYSIATHLLASDYVKDCGGIA